MPPLKKIDSKESLAAIRAVRDKGIYVRTPGKKTRHTWWVRDDFLKRIEALEKALGWTPEQCANDAFQVWLELREPLAKGKRTGKNEDVDFSHSITPIE